MGALDRGRPARPLPVSRRVALVARDPGAGAPGREDAPRSGGPSRAFGPVRRPEAPPAAPPRLHRQRVPARRARGSPPRERRFGRCFPFPAALPHGGASRLPGSDPQFPPRSGGTKPRAPRSMDGGPGGAGGTWPFPSIETDVSYKEGVLRIRKFRASRDSAAVRISGSLDTRKRIVSANGSGGGDVSLRGRVLRLARARAKLWGGVLDADGVVRIDSGRLEGKASLRRVSLGAVPWEALGVPVALARGGDASVRVAGTPDRIEGAVSFSIPGGMERISSPGAGAAALRFPMSLEANGSVSGGGGGGVEM